MIERTWIIQETMLHEEVSCALTTLKISRTTTLQTERCSLFLCWV